MARKPARSKAHRSTPPAAAPSPGTPREKIIAAFMALLAEKSIETDRPGRDRRTRRRFAR